MKDAEQHTIKKLARHRARYTGGLVWHAGAFVVIGSFPELLHALGSGGIDSSDTVITAWGFGLAFHTIAWFINRFQLRDILAS